MSFDLSKPCFLRLINCRLTLLPTLSIKTKYFFLLLRPRLSLHSFLHFLLIVCVSPYCPFHSFLARERRRPKRSWRKGVSEGVNYNKLCVRACTFLWSGFTITTTTRQNSLLSLTCIMLKLFASYKKYRGERETEILCASSSSGDDFQDSNWVPCFPRKMLL